MKYLRTLIVFGLFVPFASLVFIPQGEAQMGYGMHGNMWGPGPGAAQEGGWSYCPYCGRNLRGQGGYPMGPGMMGPGYGGNGMMGRGYYGHHGMGPGMMGPGYGGYMMGWDADNAPHNRGYADWGNLSDADAAKLRASQRKFYQDTQSLRNQIDQKQLALSSEMDRANPNRDRVMKLQKELSKLQSEFDQKALAHRLEIRKLLPDNYQGNAYGYEGR